jgi:UDP-2,3-diacylglucosamine pyrophosphatase LpxH
MLTLIRHELPRNYSEIEIYPVSDVHVGDSNTDIKLFEDFLDFVIKEPNRYITLQGDLMNNALKSSVSNCYNETMSPSQQKEYLIKKLRPVKDRILCFVPGNHEYRSTKDADNKPIYDIALALEKEMYYRENGAFIKISFGKNRTTSNGLTTYVLYCTHGSGGGKATGGSINNLESYANSIDNVDIVIMGHVHRKASTKISKVVVDVHNNVIRQKDVLCFISPAWQDYGGYGMRHMFKPTSKGFSTIVLNGKQKEFNAIV